MTRTESLQAYKNKHGKHSSGNFFLTIKLSVTFAIIKKNLDCLISTNGTILLIQELKNNLTLHCLKLTCVPLLNGHPMLAATVRNYRTVLAFVHICVLISYNILHSI